MLRFASSFREMSDARGFKPASVGEPPMALQPAESKVAGP
jgi:hypothetical protein